MERQGLKGNGVTFIGVLRACSHAGLIEDGLMYLDAMKKVYNIRPTLEHYACIVDLFCRVGRLEEAEEFINKMPIQPDDVVWKIFLGACKGCGYTYRGKEAAKHAVELNSDNPTPYVLLSNVYATNESFDEVSDISHTKKVVVGENVAAAKLY